MKPEIFMDDFERTEYGDGHYAILGRLLTLATRFEANATSLSIALGLKYNRDILASRESVEHLVREIRKKRLYRNLKAIGEGSPDVMTILDKARLARNEVAHDIATGLDRCFDLVDQSTVDTLILHAERVASQLASGDLILCGILSLVTREPLPRVEFLRSYTECIVRWVCDE